MTDAPTDNGNGVKTRVDIAVVNTKVDEILRRFDKFESKLDAMCDDIECHDRRITKVESKTDALAVANGIFTTIAAAIAGWVGSR